MKKILTPLVVFLLACAGCGRNPLLKALASDYFPVRVGNNWMYLSPDHTKSRQVDVVATGYFFGRDAYKLAVADVNVNTPGASSYNYYLARTLREVEVYDAGSGAWTLQRKLPYLVGNRWDLPFPPGNNIVSRLMYVDGKDAVEVPAGRFSNCCRLRDTIVTMDASGNTSPATSFIWAAPDVGEIRTGSMDATGVTTTDLELTSYKVVLP